MTTVFYRTSALQEEQEEGRRKRNVAKHLASKRTSRVIILSRGSEPLHQWTKTSKASSLAAAWFLAPSPEAAKDLDAVLDGAAALGPPHRDDLGHHVAHLPSLDVSQEALEDRREHH